MKGSIPRSSGLGDFVTEVRNTRAKESERIAKCAEDADAEMYKEGIVLCADLCNTSLTFEIKKKSPIKYINLLEVFGIDRENADKRLADIEKIADTAKGMSLPYSIVPHSVYSMSLSLLRLLKEQCVENKITSIHFMETEAEESFLRDLSGPLVASFEKSGLLPKTPEAVRSHSDAILNEITTSGNLILVHNTFVDTETLRKIKVRKGLYWCLCPNSNIYIENKIPPLRLLMNEKCDLVTGTDSLASNSKLSILEELKTLQKHFPEVNIEDLVLWATLNGARALGEDDKFGKIEVGMKPGLLLIENVDLFNMNLTPESFVTRLI
jgi:cytosine/adenosine deaminase-related metal-dependent hydrolase